MSGTASPTPPRDGSITIAGQPWLARMIDKARLEAQGTIDVFDLEYPCPMDQRLLAQMGISGKDFQAIVLASDSDEAIVDALKQRQALPA